MLYFSSSLIIFRILIWYFFLRYRMFSWCGPFPSQIITLHTHHGTHIYCGGFSYINSCDNMWSYLSSPKELFLHLSLFTGIITFLDFLHILLSVCTTRDWEKITLRNWGKIDFHFKTEQALHLEACTSLGGTT